MPDKTRGLSGLLRGREAQNEMHGLAKEGSVAEETEEALGPGASEGRVREGLWSSPHGGLPPEKRSARRSKSGFLELSQNKESSRKMTKLKGTGGTPVLQERADRAIFFV